MTDTLTIHRAGPGLTLQDMGRPGYLALGLSRGGAADRLALAEGAALLGQPANLTAIEMTGMGGEFETSRDTRIALTGAPMAASIDGTRIAWNASHTLPAQARIKVAAPPGRTQNKTGTREIHPDAGTNMLHISLVICTG